MSPVLKGVKAITQAASGEQSLYILAVMPSFLDVLEGGAVVCAAVNVPLVLSCSLVSLHRLLEESEIKNMVPGMQDRHGSAGGSHPGSVLGLVCLCTLVASRKGCSRLPAAG